MKVVITDCRYPNLSLERDLFERTGMELVVGQCRTPEEVIAAGQGASALLVQYCQIPRAVFEGLPQVRIMVRYGVGVDVFDVEAARERGVWLANVPDYGPSEVAAHAFAMAISLLRHIPAFDRSVRAGQWHYLETGKLRRLKTLTFGVLGLGRIGSITAGAAKFWFGSVIGCDPYLDTWPEGVKAVDHATLFRESDVLTLHAPLTEETRAMVNEVSLASMRPGSVVINTARGGLVNTDDLVNALESGHIAAAGLDVHEHEPLPEGHPLRANPNVLLSPHCAFYSEQSIVDLRTKAVQNIIDWAQTGRPNYVVLEGRSG